jgi:hypothetical protein
MRPAVPTRPNPTPSVPAPRQSPEHRRRPNPTAGVRAEPGWLTLVEALDRAAAAQVARLEHLLTRTAGPDDLARRRRQLAAARRLEATTSAAAAQARRTRGPSAADVPTAAPARRTA